MKLLFSLFIIGLTTSCVAQEGQKRINELFRNTKPVQAQMTRIDIPSDQIKEPLSLAAVGNKLLAKDYRGDPMVSVYNVDIPAWEGSIQAKGKGPYEMLKISSMYGAENQVCVYSVTDGKVFWRRVDSLKQVAPQHVVHVPAGGRDLFWFRVMPVSGNRYVVNGILDPTTKAQFALLDDSLRVTRYFDSFPVEGTPMANLPHQQQSMGFQGQLTRSPDGRRMMWTPMTGTIFRFYDFSGRKPLKIREHILHVASFEAREENPNGAAQDRDNELGVLSATADNGHFYALYSPKQLKDRSLEASDIYVFDLRGNPVQHLVLDRPATQIAWVPGADNGRGALYAFGKNRESLEPEIFKITF